MITEYLNQEKERLNALLLAAQKDKQSAPEGRLRISHASTRPEFYYRKSPEIRKGKYIPKDQIALAKALAQKAYAEKFEKAVNQKIGLIDRVLNEYETNPLEEVYLNLTPVRQQITATYTLTDREIIEKWLATPYEPNPNHPENRDQETANKEKVRSKSEVIIADNLKLLGIPYKYEAPIKLPNGKLIYPDFTCLNARRRKLVYIEHFGKMGDEEYRHNDFFWKLKHFESAGLIQGKNLLMTFEDENHPFNFSTYKGAIMHLLLN